MRSIVLIVALLAVLSSAQTLGKYSVDRSGITVSGISSGAFMANQLHVAYSATFRGAGNIAGGAYYCAQASLTTALTACMVSPNSVNVNTLVNAAKNYANGGDIDPVFNLAKSRVYIYAGTQDTTVYPGESKKLEEFYAAFVNGTDPKDGKPYVVTEYSITSGHAHITNFFGNTCSQTRTPYINNCNYDQSGVLLQHLYYQLKARGTYISSNLLKFSQTEFRGDSMDATGFIYVPSTCAAGATCKLHVALHGCLQNWDQATVGTDYVEFAGYNEWAESNGIIILYPQAEPDLAAGNANACWDWWGYAGRDYATKTGSQMKAIYDMVQRVISGTPALAAPSGLTITGVTDNAINLTWRAVNDATAYEIERDNVRVSPAGGVTSLTFSDTRLSSGTTYSYVVIALNNAGASSPKSEPVTGTTTGVPPPLAAPIGLGAESVLATEVYLAWSAVAGANGYLVFRNNAQVGNVTLTTFIDRGLTPETTYTYTIRAINLYESGPTSSPLVVTTASSWQCGEYTDNNYNHVVKNRAYQRAGYVYANGSNDYMGLYNVAVRTTLAETAEGYYEVGSC